MLWFFVAAIVGAVAYYAPWPPSEFRARRTFLRHYPGVELLNVTKNRDSDIHVSYHFHYRRLDSQQTATATVSYVEYEGGWVEISGFLPEYLQHKNPK